MNIVNVRSLLTLSIVHQAGCARIRRGRRSLRKGKKNNIERQENRDANSYSK